jgi:NAD(P)-dependent dehydrogenase (short-subunit alcohol dehydrogenase family)
MAVKQRLAGLKAVVTGAAGAIGEAVVKTLAKNGAEVLAVDGTATSVVNRYSKASGVTGLAVDYAGGSTAEKILAAVKENLGVLDIVVHADGIEYDSAVAADGLENWIAVCEAGLELRATLNQRLIPLLQRSPAGRILHIAVPLALFDPEDTAALAASRHALGSLTRSLASQLGASGITVNTVQPGAIMTPALRGFFRKNAELRDWWIESAAAKRLGEPVDVAKVCLFLATDEAAFVSGQEIMVDGGAAQLL